MTSGLVVSVSPRNVGDVLSAAVSVGATVLPVSDACEFDEEFDEPRYLVIGETLTPLEYVAVENDDNAAQQTVTLAAPLLFSAEADMPVTLWDPTVEAADKRAIVFEAQVLLDDQDDATIPATIEHETIPLAGVYSLEGARVALDDDEGEWFVSRVLGRQAVVSQDTIDIPRSLNILPADKDLVHREWTTINLTAAFDSPGIITNLLNGQVRPGPGMFGYVATATFEANSNGGRGIRSRIHFIDGSSQIDCQIKTVPVDGQSSVQVSNYLVFDGLRIGISFEVFQSSGGTLRLIGSDGGVTSRPTHWTLTRLAG